MTSSVLVSLAKGVRLRDGSDSVLTVESPQSMASRVTLKNVTPALASALERLGQGAEIPYLFAKVMTEEGPGALPKLKHYLGTLGRNGLIEHRLMLDERPLLVLKPCVGSGFRYDSELAKKDTRFVLSRFACTRREGAVMVLETPLGHAAVELHGSPALLALFELTSPHDAVGLAEAVEGFDEETALSFLNFLANAKAAQAVDEQERAAEDLDTALRQWSFVDLLFHSRSRLGRHSEPYGGTFPFQGVFEPLPAARPAHEGPVHPLVKPNLEVLEREDLPFTKVLEGRVSIRKQSRTTPITAEQLGEFLYRTARVKKVVENTVSFRPSPSGGATHSLEIYPLVERCEGLERALYHYDPFEHVLRRVSQPTPPLEALSEIARRTAMLDQRSQVLFLVAARFQRVQFKYQSVGYALILKDLGALYQTMYLVATAMGLAPCGLGGGHSDLFANAVGTDYFAETTVGEFLLGTVDEEHAGDEHEHELWQPPAEG